jgi:hypothetical protein
MKEIQSYLLPAFKGMKFGSPSCDSNDDGEVFIHGLIFENDDVTYDYEIDFYPKEDKVRIEIVRRHNGNLTRIGSTDFWAIEGSNITAKSIAEMKRLLDAKLPNK